MSRDALVVGINQYPYISPLKTPAFDAEAIAHILERYGNFRVKRLPVTGQINALQVDPKQSVTVAELKTAIAQLFNPQGDNIPDTALLYFAGHGLRETLGGISEGYLATSDACPRKNIWGVSLQWLRRLLQESPVRQQIVWLDCCHSGELLNFDEADPGNREGRDRCFIAASRDFEVAYGGGEHGVLTNALLQALDPKRHPEGRVTTKTLVASLKQALEAVPVPQRFRHDYSGNEIILTLDRKENSTHPTFAGCPYKGLDYFKTEDHEYFYGRTALTDKLLEKVRSKNFLVVLGASGSGKSSLVRAGLLYQLQQGLKLSGSDRWQIYQPFTPGENPLQRLAEVMGKELPTPDGKFLIEQVIKDSPSDRIVLVVDQFEEVFTLCQNNSKRQQFFDCLLDTLEQTGNKFSLVLVMRTDFLDKCLPYNRLATLLGDESTHTIVTPMTAKQLEEAIRVPASKVGLEIENALIKQILEDLGASNASGAIEGETEESAQKREPESLPLLEYTLEQLWLQPRTLDLLTLTNYQELGGVRGALRKQADAIFHELTPEEQLAARRIFVSLTQLGEGTEDTRRRVAQTDLVTAQLPVALIDRVVQKFAQKRLLVITSGSATGETEAETVSPLVEVAHEALIRHWPRLRGWLDENREMLRRQRRIDAEAKQWAENGKKTEYLLQGSRLGDAEEFLATYPEELSTLAVELVRDSERERDRLQKEEEARQRRELEQERKARKAAQTRTRVAFISTFLVSAAAIFAFFQWQEVQQQAQLTALREKAATARNLLSIQPEEALALVIQATGQSLSQFSKVISPVQYSLSSIIDEVRGGTIFFAHKGNVLSVAFSPDGQTIVSGGEDKTIRLWDLKGNPIGQPFKGHENGVVFVAFSPDRKTIVSSDSKTMLRWDFKGNLIGKPINLSKGDNDEITVNSDGTIIVTNIKKGTLFRWNINGNLIGKVINLPKENLELLDNHHYAVAVSPDGKTIILSSRIDESLQKFTVNNNSITKSEKLYSSLTGAAWFCHLSFSPDSSKIAGAACSNGGSMGYKPTIRLWCNIDGCEELPKGFYDYEIESGVIAFSPDSRSIITTGFNIIGIVPATEKNIEFKSPTVNMGRELLLKVDNLKNIIDDNENIGIINQAAFSPNGKQIVTANLDGTIRLWNVNSLDIANIYDSKDVWWDWIESTIFSPDGKLIAGIHRRESGDYYINLWDIEGNRIGKPFKGNGEIRDIAFSPDSKMIVTGDKDVIRLWDLKGNSISQPFKGHQGIVTSVAFSPNGKIVVSASEDKTLRLWDLKGNSISQPFKGHQGIVTSVAFSPNGKIVVSASEDKTLRLWDLKGNSISQPFKGHQGIVTSVAFSPNGKIVVSASKDKTLRLWDLKGNPAGLQVIRGHEDAVQSVAFSPDGQSLASMSIDSTVMFWDINSGNLISPPIQISPKISLNNITISSSVAFNPDGRKVIASIWRRQRSLSYLIHGNWQSSLEVACQRWGYYYIFTTSESDVTKEATKTCQEYIWSKTETEQILAKQGRYQKR